MSECGGLLLSQVLARVKITFKFAAFGIFLWILISLVVPGHSLLEPWTSLYFPASKSGSTIDFAEHFFSRSWRFLAHCAVFWRCGFMGAARSFWEKVFQSNYVFVLSWGANVADSGLLGVASFVLGRTTALSYVSPLQILSLPFTLGQGPVCRAPIPLLFQHPTEVRVKLAFGLADRAILCYVKLQVRFARCWVCWVMGSVRAVTAYNDVTDLCSTFTWQVRHVVAHEC
jgi:hypothetical protein